MRNKNTLTLIGVLVLLGAILVGGIALASRLYAGGGGLPAGSPSTAGSQVGNQIAEIDWSAATAPVVVETRPSSGGILPVDSAIEVVFDHQMDMASVEEAWRFSSSDGEAITGSFEWLDGKTVRFTPAQRLSYAAGYALEVGEGAANENGVPLGAGIELRFTTPAEFQVSQVFPADGADQIAGDAAITVIFNQPVVPLAIAEERDELPQPLEISPPVEGKGEWISTSVYAFHPRGFLAGARQYTVTVKAGLPTADGSASLKENYTWSFTTLAPRLGDLVLSNGVVNPTPNYRNVLLDAFFTLRFYQPMDTAATQEALSLSRANGEAVPLTTAWKDELTQLIITPTQRLALGADYILSLSTDALAADGGKLEKGLEWNFTTVPPPALVSTLPGDGDQGTWYDRNLTLRFASPMNIESVKKAIQITPPPAAPIEWWYNEWDWSLSTYSLQPSTQYTVRLSPGMEDIYGNRTTREEVIRFRTGPYQPAAYFQMPYAPSMFRGDDPGTAQEFFAAYRNISRVVYRLYRLEAEEFVALQSGRLSQWEYRPQPDRLVWERGETSGAELDELVLSKYALSDEAGKPLPYGFYLLTLDSAEVTHSSPFVDVRLVFVANANATYKGTMTEALVWLTGLASGAPLSGAEMTVYDKDFQALGTGKTDQNGVLSLDVPAPEDPYEPRYVMGTDERAFAFTASDWGSGVNLYDYGIWSDYYAPPNRPVAYIYTDRPVYRPGQPVYYKGILRLDDDLKYSLPDLKEARVTISNFEEVVAEETLTLTQYGSFSGEFTLDQNARLGNYAISVAFPGSEFAIGTVSFDVAEYRKPEFMVLAEVAEEDVLAGASFTATVQAEYYSGGAVAGSPVRWSLASLPYTFGQDGDLARFSFADLQEDVYGPGQEEFYASKIIAEGEGQLDATGALSLTLLADLLDAPTSRMFVFEATVMDISGNPVTSRDSLRVHKSAVYPGVRSLGYVGQVGEEQTFEIISVDWDGTPLPEQRVDVEILERRWHSVQEQDAQGRIKWTSSVQEIPVASFTGVLMDADGLARVSFTPENGGVFAARVTARDASGNQAVAAAYMWVAGGEYVPWQQTNDRGFKLIADKDSYLPGETAELLIASPFQGKAYALVTVERGRIQQHEVIELESNSTIYKLPVDAQMAPNVYLSVVIVKGVDETNPRPNFKMGVAQLKVDTQAQQLRVSLQPDREQAGPRDQVRYTVTTRDMDGNPVQAEVSLALTDLATLSLRDPNAPPLLDYFYASRSLGVWTSVPIVVSLEEFNAFISEGLVEGKAMGAGGGKGEGELGIIEVREEFPDTAFWEAHLVTSPTGEASVSVTLPDNLTTWRMDARAVSKDTRVGQATHDLVSSKPLLVRPQTPRFFIVGDKARLGSTVHNNSDETLNVSVRLEGEGFSVEGDAMQVLEIAANSQAYVTWGVNINPDATRVDLVVSAEGGGYRDASRPPVGTLDKQGIPVYRFEAHETVGTSGVMAEPGVRVEAIHLPAMMQSAVGDLTIQLAPSLAAGMTDGLQYLVNYPYDCVEQAISRFLPNLMYLRALKADGKEDAQMAARIGQQVNITLQRLVNWQNADGGWGWWSRDKSHPMTSAYVVLGLLEAQQAGYTVDEAMLGRGQAYLTSQLLTKSRLREPTLRNRQAFILYVLARAGKADASKSVQLFDERLGMSYFARAFLANTLYQIDPRDERIQTLLSDLSSAAILSAGGTHWEEESEDVWNWNTDTRTTAIVLAMLSQIDPENPLNANAARWLMSHRTRGHWNGTQETAWSLMALVNWMLASGEREARYDYGLAVNGEEVLSGTVSPETIDDAKVLRIDVSELLREQANKVAFVKSVGSGNLYYTAYMDVSLPVEQVQALDRGIVVSRNYYTNDEQNELVEEAHVGEVLVARITLVVPHDLHYVVVDDPLPAGLEPIDQSLKTSPQNETPNQYSWKDLATTGWGWWYFDHVELRDEKVTLSADYLPAGTYVYSYLVQVMTPGEFKTIPPTAQEFYFPDVYGRGSGSLFTVLP